MFKSDHFEVAVPSYHRAETCRDTTLSMLADNNIDADRITVFVANEDEQLMYRDVLLSGTYGRLVVGEKGINAIRNIVMRHYKAGTNVLGVDDDIRGMYERVSSTQLQPVSDLQSFVNDAFRVTKMSGASLWGVYPTLNPMFMKPTVTTDLRYIVACFYGWIAQPKDNTLAVTLDDKEDYERSILHYLKDGAVVRFNYVAPKTRYYSEPGGMQVERTKQRIKDSAMYLCKTYPMLCSLNTTKKSGKYEVRLRDKRIFEGV